jgi:hypothetical protein
MSWPQGLTTQTTAGSCWSTVSRRNGNDEIRDDAKTISFEIDVTTATEEVRGSDK